MIFHDGLGHHHVVGFDFGDNGVYYHLGLDVGVHHVIGFGSFASVGIDLGGVYLLVVDLGCGGGFGYGGGSGWGVGLDGGYLFVDFDSYCSRVFDFLDDGIAYYRLGVGDHVVELALGFDLGVLGLAVGVHHVIGLGSDGIHLGVVGQRGGFDCDVAYHFGSGIDLGDVVYHNVEVFRLDLGGIVFHLG